MALVIEDGSGLPNSTSFVTVEEARQYAAARGIELAPIGAEGDAAIEIMLIFAVDYLNSLEEEYSGVRVSPLTQALCYPRKNSTYYNNEYPDDEIPNLLKKAQCQLCIEQKNGTVLMPSQAAGSAAIVREKVGPLETEYATGTIMSLTSPTMVAVAGLLAPLFAYGGFGLRIVRA